MFCSNCGTNCPDNVNNCPNCGAPVGKPQDQPSQNPYGQQPYYGQQQPYYGQQSPYGYSIPAQPKNTKPVLVLGIVALVICASMGCLCGCLGALPGIVCAIISIVLGSKAKKEMAPGVEDKNVKTGMLLSYIALGVAVLFIVLNAILGGAIAVSDYL